MASAIEASFGESGTLRVRRRTQTRAFLRRRPLGTLGLALLLCYIVVALVAPQVVPYPPNSNGADALASPSAAHLFGTDDLGRDLLSRCLIGIRISITVGFAATLIAGVVGSTAGALSGFFGGPLDMLLMRIIDVLVAFPALLLAIAIVALFGAGELQVSLAIACIFFPTFARLARAGVLSERRRDYVEAAAAAGASQLRLIALDIAPNIVTPLVLQAALSIGFAILIEAGLSFLGLGLRPPTPLLGGMISEARVFMQDKPSFVLIPGLLLVGLIFSLQGTADLLGEWLDPRQRKT